MPDVLLFDLFRPFFHFPLQETPVEFFLRSFKQPKTISCLYCYSILVPDVLISRPLFIFPLQKKPVEFFGVPLNDQTLSDAPAPLVLGTCRTFVTDETYEAHFHRLTSGNQTPTQVLRNFFEVLAGLDFDVQEECFEIIVKVLRAQSGSMHVAERLQEGKIDIYSRR